MSFLSHKKSRGALAAAFMAAAPAAGIAADSGLSPLDEIRDTIARHYVTPVARESLTGGTPQEIMDHLDGVSEYLSPEEYAADQLEKSGRFGGIGIDMQQLETGTKVEGINPDGPAKNKLGEGDIITHVDDGATLTPLAGLDFNKARAALRGPAGTHITLTVMRPGANEPVQVRIVRADILIKTVKTRIIGNDIAYIKLTSFFNETAARQFTGAMIAANARMGGNLRGYIIDLRGNQGGFVDQAKTIIDEFFDDGAMYSIRGRTSMSTSYAAKGQIANSRPVALLVDGWSASASEIMTGAFKDRGRAKIIGTRTYGKGSVQYLHTLAAGGALRLTGAHYHTPSGAMIHKKGIWPHILVPSAETRRAEDVGALPPDGGGPEQVCTESDAAGNADEFRHPSGRVDLPLACAVDFLRGTQTASKTAPFAPPTP